MWFTALTLSAPAGTIAYDLSVDGGGPRAVFGGIVNAVPFTAWPLWIALAGLAALVGIGARQRRGSAPA
jgi:MYXO-CTERM domain-containing protein